MVTPFPEKNAIMVKVREMIYPFYDERIEVELKEYGITEVYSFGDVQLGKYRIIGKGKTGIVVYIGGGKVVKIRRADSPKESLKIEGKIQELAYPVAPKVYYYGNNFIVMDYIAGRHLEHNEKVEVIIKLLEAAKILEDKKIEHRELVRPYKNVLVSDRVYVIDYDDASVKENPKNVTSILSWLKRVDLARKYLKGVPFDQIVKELLEVFS